MTFLRSMHAFAMVAIFATLLTALAPIAIQMPMAGAPQGGIAETSMPDCGMCPKAGEMVMTGCLQLICGLPAMETDAHQFAAFGPARYAPAVVSEPAEWHTIPPVSPG